jgi:hypothetical protein
LRSAVCWSGHARGGRAGGGRRACGRAVSACCCVRRPPLPFVVVAARSSGFEAPGTRHKCAFTACPGRADLPLAPHSLIPGHPKPAVLFLGSAPVQPRAHAIRRRPDCRRLPRLYPSAKAPCHTPVDSPPHCRVVPGCSALGPTNAPTLVFQAPARLGQYRCASVSLEPQAAAGSNQHPATSNPTTLIQPPATASNRQQPQAPSLQPQASKPGASRASPPATRPLASRAAVWRWRHAPAATSSTPRRPCASNPFVKLHGLLSLYQFLSHCLHFPRVMRAGIGLPRNDATTTWPPQPCRHTCHAMMQPRPLCHTHA